jgi:hypothetical protein
MGKELILVLLKGNELLKMMLLLMEMIFERRKREKQKRKREEGVVKVGVCLFVLV